jgi:large subunit ribosomal protein L19
MKNSIIAEFEKKHYTEVVKLPDFRPGDTVRVSYNIVEGGGDSAKKVRTQPFEGVVIRYKKGTADGTFTVRKIGANGIGVERVFPIYSPNVSKVEVIANGSVRRSRLFYLRDRAGKAARIKSRYLGKQEEAQQD